MDFPLSYLHLTLTRSKCEGQGRTHFAGNILQVVKGMANIVIASK